MNTPCPFSDAQLTFAGTPAQQARCLLRKVKIGGNVDDTPAVLPALLDSLVGQPVDFTRAQLASYLQTHGIDEADIGGRLSDPLCQVPSGKRATYFVIHDTSDELSGSSFPANINTSAWSNNNLATRSVTAAHVFLNRVGQSRSEIGYHRVKQATKFERTGSTGHGSAVRGLFLHHELIQPRIRGTYAYHAVAPTPGFPPATYARLAVCYLAASVRKGEWLIPVFHCVLDLQQKPEWHDDPQNFDLEAWNTAITGVLAAVKGFTTNEKDLLLKSDALKGDATLEAVARSHSKLVPGPDRNPAVARVQRTLNRLSDHTPDYAIDLGPNEQFAGFFGSKTTRAVNALQRNHGFAVSGEVGSSTILALDAECLQMEGGSPLAPPPPGTHDHGAPVGSVRLWRESAGYAEDVEDTAKGWARTTGIRGTHQTYADGCVISVGEETLTAKRRQTTYAAVVARQTRVLTAGVHHITQTGYCHDGRQLPDAIFKNHHPGLTGGDVKRGYSTRFGKSDDADEGTGSEAFGIVQTSSEVCGCSVRKSILREWFGDNYATDPRRLTAMVEIFFTRNNRYACVPLTDVGPAESSPALIDLTWAVDLFLGTDGGDLDYDVTFRVIMP